MTTWTRREHRTRTVQYVVPAPPPVGACWNQVQQALNAAIDEAKEHFDHGVEPADDTIHVHAWDEEIVISLELPFEPTTRPEPGS